MVKAADESGLSNVASGIKAELKALLTDLPDLQDAVLMDDTPTANRETQEWIREQILPPKEEPVQPYYPALIWTTSKCTGTAMVNDGEAAEPSIWQWKRPEREQGAGDRDPHTGTGTGAVGARALSAAAATGRRCVCQLGRR